MTSARRRLCSFTGKQMHLSRIDAIGQNGGEALHYDTKTIDGVVYRKNQAGAYALYLHTKTGSWRESALVTNKELENDITN